MLGEAGALDRLVDGVVERLAGKAIDSAEELETLLEVSAQQLAESTERLVGAGAAVWRGPKLYAA